MKVICKAGVGYLLELYGERIAITRNLVDELRKKNIEVRYES